MDLTYEQIPQRVYLIDGVPAKTYGEWPGIKPNHWRGSLRVIRPNQTQKIFDRECTIPLAGRRHFSEKRSEELKNVVGKKLFTSEKNLENISEKPRGLKKVNLKNTIEKIQYDKRHFPPKFGINNDPECLHIRTYKPDGNYRTFIEIPIEKEFGIKKKIWTLEERRNGMKLINPGDKYYKATDHIANFFKEGGLIVGSTNRINFNKTQSIRANDFYETLDINNPILDKNKLWKNKVKAENFNFDNKYVRTLNEWEKNILADYLSKDNDKDKEKDKDKDKSKINKDAKKPAQTGKQIAKGKKK